MSDVIHFIVFFKVYLISLIMYTAESKSDINNFVVYGRQHIPPFLSKLKSTILCMIYFLTLPAPCQDVSSVNSQTMSLLQTIKIYI